MKEDRQRWQKFYGSAPPVAHLLRNEIPDRWLRIHSLAETKRYPQTLDEYSILLSRHNTVATEVLGVQTRCKLFVSQYGEHPQSGIDTQDVPQLEDLTFTFFNSLVDPTEPEKRIMNIWCAPVLWSSGQFDNLIKAVADDNAPFILFASLLTGEVYHPYDGGADIFVTSSKRQSELKQQFWEWLSKSPSGL
ncbi:hypothetical protein F7734_10420 [Scytonema sp. UIC 10036]|uniref:DUF3885 domain-containing protein n=1 Tax=Scytonema sp. UIC 10036 TaxID=2304196 RepID=UPI0012DA0E32|nr:hypothetical protein [Scytonema sp. UIC 10036]MUG92840.1 hypothetical protein [Scytonema sp. UIC 10036]